MDGTTHLGASFLALLSTSDLVVLPRLHAATCACFVCTADLAIEDYRAELTRADSEEDGETDGDIDFARGLAAAYAEAA